MIIYFPRVVPMPMLLEFFQWNIKGKKMENLLFFMHLVKLMKYIKHYKSIIKL